MNNSDLTGKTAVITGITGTLGYSMALALAERGADILGQFSTSESKARIISEKLTRIGIKVKTVKLDFSVNSSPETLIQEALSLPGKLSFLINSASVFENNTLNSVTEKQITEAVSVNAAVPLILSREFRKYCNDGVIVNMLDARMVDYDKKHIAYSLSKQMLFSLTRMMSVEFAPDIRVNAIAPGMISMPDNTAAALPEGIMNAITEAALLKRTGDIKSVIQALFFLIENDYVTGETVFIDGGRNIRGKMFGL